jgi:hypothetical protein
MCSGEPERPLKKNGGTSVAPVSAEETAPKAKDSSVHRHAEKLRRELLEPWTLDAVSTTLLKTSTCPDKLIAGIHRIMSNR